MGHPSQAANRERRHFLVVISHADALAWVLTGKRMAFPLARRTQVETIETGDSLFLYTARDCFGNPTRDRGRVIARANIVNSPVLLADPVHVAHREFHYVCDLQLGTVAPPRQGVEVARLVDNLDSFPDKRHWSVRLRRPPLELTFADSRIISTHLDPLVEPLPKHLPAYIELGKRLTGK